MFFYILMIIIGFILLVVGADFLIKGSSNIAKKFHIPETLIGLTIVALGTSAPELIITITSASSSSTDLIIGNAIGSNLCNLLLIIGLMSVLIPIKLDRDIVKIHLPVALLSAVVIFIMVLGAFISPTATLNRVDGIILIIMFFIYFSYPIYAEVKDIVSTYKENKENDNKPKINIFLSLLFIIIGVVLLKYGGDLVVNYAESIAQEFNLSERVIGLTIIAMGTAMPELVTSILAVIKKDTDLAVGNLIGSCVLNLFLILGIGSIITPLTFSSEFNQNLILLIISTLILFLFNFIGKKYTITRWKGIILLIIFSVYIIELL